MAGLIISRGADYSFQNDIVAAHSMTVDEAYTLRDRAEQETGLKATVRCDYEGGTINVVISYPERLFGKHDCVTVVTFRHAGDYERWLAKYYDSLPITGNA